jgi:hypothetical protein
MGVGLGGGGPARGIAPFSLALVGVIGLAIAAFRERGRFSVTLGFFVLILAAALWQILGTF